MKTKGQNKQYVRRRWNRQCVSKPTKSLWETGNRNFVPSNANKANVKTRYVEPNFFENGIATTMASTQKRPTAPVMYCSADVSGISAFCSSFTCTDCTAKRPSADAHPIVMNASVTSA